MQKMARVLFSNIGKEWQSITNAELHITYERNQTKRNAQIHHQQSCFEHIASESSAESCAVFESIYDVSQQ